MKSEKSCEVLLRKKQLFILENYVIWENRQIYQNINCERAYLKSRWILFKEKKLGIAHSKIVSILIYPTVL